MRRPLALALLPCLAILACSTDGDSGNNDPCTRYALTLGGYFDRCLGATGGRAELQAAIKTHCDRLLVAPGVSPDLGSAILGCSDAFASVSCKDSLRFVCEPPNGTLADGAGCLEDVQCATGRCELKSNEACGTCAPTLPVGASCAGDVECAEGAACASVDGSETDVCTTTATVGAGEKCDYSARRCAAGLECTDGECAVRVAAGGSCRREGECEGELACSDEGQCVVAPAAGQPCAQSRCAQGHGCDIEANTCKAIVVVGLGDACDLVRQCGAGSCEGLSFTSSSDDPGRTTVTPGKCMAFLAPGAACGEGIEGSCARLARCVDGTCVESDFARCQ
jgi:hypothetical protein